MSDSDTANRKRLLKPDTRNLNTTGKRYHPSGVDHLAGGAYGPGYLLEFLHSYEKHQKRRYYKNGEER